MSANAGIVELSLENFRAEVLERSRTVPVLVDFWATWCAPCRTLGPILERLAAEHAGRFVLAKADIDRLAELAEAFGVQSVPTVALVRDGQIVDGFVGALPEARVRELLARHLGPVSDPLAEAAALESQGQRAQARARLEAELGARPGAAAVRAQLSRLCALDGDDARARELLAGLDDAGRELEAARAAGNLLELRARQAELAPLQAAVQAAPRDAGARLALGRALLSAGGHAEALAELYRAAELELGFQGGEPRRALIEAFGVLGEEHPLTREYRRKLSHLLCS